MVCLGNICRSPLAEGILKAKLPENFVVDSAGTIAMHEGQHPDRRAIITASNHGVDIASQQSRPIQKSDLDKYDLIFCMDHNNLNDVQRLAVNQQQIEKIALLLAFAGNPSIPEVPDPYWGNLDDFEKVYQLLDNACETISTLLQTHQISQK